MVKNQIGFKSSAGIHPFLLSFLPFFRFDAGLRRSAGRKSTPPPEAVMDVQRLKKAGAPRQIQRRRRQTTRKKEEPATFAARRNDTPTPRKSKEAGRENRDNKRLIVNLRRQSPAIPNAFHFSFSHAPLLTSALSQGIPGARPFLSGILFCLKGIHHLRI